MQSLSPEQGLTLFIDELLGRNVASGTITAYQSSIRQFLTWLREMDEGASITAVADISRRHVSAYLTHQANRSLSGVYRRRQLAALRAYFACMVQLEAVDRAPTDTIAQPKKAQTSREALRPDEYRQLLSASAANLRDNCIFQLFLQTGIRVKELCALTLDDVDQLGRQLVIQDGKGSQAAVLPLEKKALTALQSYLGQRPLTGSRRLFLNCYGQPLSERGVRKMVARYAQLVHIRKPVKPHVLRHTFIDTKAASGVPILALKKLARHRNLNTTQLYIHEAADRMDLARIQEQSSL